MSTTVESKATNSQTSKVICPLCSQQHMLYVCEQFLNMSPAQRYEIVKQASICRNCFLSNHRTIDCRRGPCRKCQRRHNTLLHFSQETLVDKNTIPQTSIDPRISTTNLVSFQGQSQSQIVFMDSCSQSCTISEKFVRSLGLKLTKIDIKLKGVENLQSEIKYQFSKKHVTI